MRSQNMFLYRNKTKCLCWYPSNLEICYFCTEIYVVGTHQNCLIVGILMSNIYIKGKWYTEKKNISDMEIPSQWRLLFKGRICSPRIWSLRVAPIFERFETEVIFNVVITSSLILLIYNMKHNIFLTAAQTWKSQTSHHIHTVVQKILLSISYSKTIITLNIWTAELPTPYPTYDKFDFWFDLKLYGPVKTVKVMSSRSVNLLKILLTKVWTRTSDYLEMYPKGAVWSGSAVFAQACPCKYLGYKTNITYLHRFCFHNIHATKLKKKKKNPQIANRPVIIIMAIN